MGFFEPVLCTSAAVATARVVLTASPLARRACLTTAAPGEASRGRDGRSWGAFCLGFAHQGPPPPSQPPASLPARSGKFMVLCRLLHWLRTNTDDRIVIVSNYTQTLDLFQQLCREKCVLLLCVSPPCACLGI